MKKERKHEEEKGERRASKDEPGVIGDTIRQKESIVDQLEKEKDYLEQLHLFSVVTDLLYCMTSTIYLVCLCRIKPAVAHPTVVHSTTRLVEKFPKVPGTWVVLVPEIRLSALKTAQLFLIAS